VTIKRAIQILAILLLICGIVFAGLHFLKKDRNNENPYKGARLVLAQHRANGAGGQL